jgi:sirohydrochlorin cobaltochelatase
MRIVIVLAVHGAPPSDFPREELAEFMALHAGLEHGHGHGASPAGARERHATLEARIRAWPRNPGNDPFHEGSRNIAAELEKASGLPVILGFNEFCGPSLDDALGLAASTHDRVIVITPMLTAGGGHAAEDIPAAIARARLKQPKARISYAWPFPAPEVAQFLAAQVAAQVAAAKEKDA